MSTSQISGTAAETPPHIIALRRLTELTNHAARHGLPYPSIDTPFPDDPELIAIMVGSERDLRKWAEHLGQPVLDEQADRLIHLWTAGDMLDVRVIVEYERIDRRAVKPEAVGLPLGGAA